MIEKAFREVVPCYLSPSDFWQLSLSDLKLVTENLSAYIWTNNHDRLTANRILAGDISCVLAGKAFPPLGTLQPPDPRSARIRSVEEVEMTLMGWAYSGEYDE